MPETPTASEPEIPTRLGGEIEFAELSGLERWIVRLGLVTVQVGALLLLLTILLAWGDIAYRQITGNADWTFLGVLSGLVAPIVSAAVVLLLPFALLQWTVVNLWQARARPVNYFASVAAGVIGVYLVFSAAPTAFEVARTLRLPAADRLAGAFQCYFLFLGLSLTFVALVSALATGFLERQTPSTWAERIVNLVLLGIGAMLTYLTATVFSFGQAVLLWTMFSLGLIIATWLGYIKLLGPVLFYDMVRTGRRNRYFIIRMLYAGFLFFILAYMVLITYLIEPEFRVRQHAVIAETFFMVFMLVQLALVVILTPAYVAGAISDEKDRKTIEFMLATDLRNREIVFSKFLSRVGNMALLLLTGLPIMSILQFIGGVDPDLMLAGFAAIALSILGIGSLSILLSTLFKRPRDSISLTYLMMIAYGALATMGYALQSLPGFRPLGTPVWFGDNAPTISDLISMLNAGNPIAAIFELTKGIGGRGRASLATVLPGLLANYAWFHLSVTVIAITWSIVRLRAIALKQTTAGTTASMRWWQRLRPAVSDSPMLWKELFIEGQTKLNWLIWCAVVVLVVITLGSGLWVVGYHVYELFEPPPRGWRFDPNETFMDRLGLAMNIWWRITGTFVGTLLILMAGVRASMTVTSERERDTFDALITTPMSAEGMLFAKIIGNLAGMKLGWIWFGSMLLLAFITGGIHPYGVPIVVAGCLVYSTFMTMVGIAFSVWCRTSLQAAVCTVTAAIVLGGGHWLITSCMCMPLFGALLAILNLRFNVPRNVERFFEEAGLYVIKFQAGITPPFVFPWCSFSWREIEDDFHFRGRERLWEFVAFCVLGLFLWWFASLLMWFFILVPKFRRIMRRVELDG